MSEVHFRSLKDEQHSNSNQHNLNNCQSCVEYASCQASKQACINNWNDDSSQSSPCDDWPSILNIKNPWDNDIVIKILCGHFPSVLWVWNAVLQNRKSRVIVGWCVRAWWAKSIVRKTCDCLIELRALTDANGILDLTRDREIPVWVIMDKYTWNQIADCMLFPERYALRWLTWGFLRPKRIPRWPRMPRRTIKTELGKIRLCTLFPLLGLRLKVIFIKKDGLFCWWVCLALAVNTWVRLIINFDIKSSFETW